MRLIEDGVFKFGKHEGEAVGDVARADAAYLHWVIGAREQLALVEDEADAVRGALEDVFAEGLMHKNTRAGEQTARLMRACAAPQPGAGFGALVVRDSEALCVKEAWAPEWLRWHRVWEGDGVFHARAAWAERYGQKAAFPLFNSDAWQWENGVLHAWRMPENRVLVAYASGKAEIRELPPPLPPALDREIVGSFGIESLAESVAQEESFSWTEEQHACLREVDAWRLGSNGEAMRGEADFGSPFFSLTGPAGAGKSTLVREIVSRYPSAVLTAMTGKAALRLSECAGRSASTLHKILYYPPKRGDDPRFVRLREPEGDFVIIDEAGMCSPGVRADLDKWAQRGVRFLLVGDSYQLPPVIVGEELKQYGEDYSVFSEVGGASLKTVMRSIGGVLRAATVVRETGQIPRESDGEYEYVRSPQGVVERAVEEYCADREDHLLITWKNETRMRANRMIREKLGHDGPLPDEGEPVLIKRNGQGFLNGEIVVCGGFEDGPQIGSLACTWMRVGARLPVVDEDFDLRPRILVTVQGGPESRGGEFFDGGLPWVDDWKAYHIALKAGNWPEPVPVTWGYCLTAHSAQGSEARRATVFLERGDERSRNFRKSTTLPGGGQVPFSARWVYTAITRGKERAMMIGGI